MKKFDFHSSILRTPSFIGATAPQQATWLKLLCYCVENEIDGKICDCKDWSENQWLICCGVSKSDVFDTSENLLYHYSESEKALLVAFYPDDQIKKWREMCQNYDKIRQKRAEAGKKGGRPKTQK
jgi:hypothetical protein